MAMDTTTPSSSSFLQSRPRVAAPRRAHGLRTHTGAARDRGDARRSRPSAERRGARRRPVGRRRFCSSARSGGAPTVPSEQMNECGRRGAGECAAPRATEAPAQTCGRWRRSPSARSLADAFRGGASSAPAGPHGSTVGRPQPRCASFVRSKDSQPSLSGWTCATTDGWTAWAHECDDAIRRPRTLDRSRTLRATTHLRKSTSPHSRLERLPLHLPPARVASMNSLFGESASMNSLFDESASMNSLFARILNRG
mmetsp:Transcript_34651/g.80306  ORF Transcript_34651/g.80306 Transcript_34651/m.80306 type:complete len:254 (-) Transcript_34651:638-1399(-)